MKKMIKIFIIFVCSIVSLNVVNAASFTINASSNLTKGGSTKLTIKGSDVTGRFNITSSNSGVISVSEDRVWIENSSYTITLNALSVGTSSITVTPVGVSDGSGNPVNLGSKSITINVSLPREKSSDSNMASLSVEGFEITPAFHKDTLEYKTEVPEGTKTVKINAKASSGYATISGSGEKEVVEGLNTFEIVVKAETGATKTYKLVVEVKDNNPIEVEVNGDNYTVVKLRDNFQCVDLFNESEVVIGEYTIPACFNENIKYTLVGLKNKDGEVKSFIYKDNNYFPFKSVQGTSLKLVLSDVGSNKYLDIFTIEIDDIKYKAYKYSDRFYILKGKNIETGESSYYLYDSKEKVFNSFELDNIISINKLNKENKIFKFACVIFGIGLFLSIICILLLSKKKGKKDINNLEDDKIVKKETKKEDKTIEVEEDANGIIENEEENIIEEVDKKTRKKSSKKASSKK